MLYENRAATPVSGEPTGALAALLLATKDNVLPLLPDTHAIAVMALTGFALFLFTRDRIPIETSSLVVLILLLVGFFAFPYREGGVSLTPADFLAGFGNEALVAVCALMIIGKGIEVTGALRPVTNFLALHWGQHPQLSLLLILIFGALVSAFLNNTPIVVVMIPILIGVALRAESSPSHILMPVGFATIAGGMGTVIGTSTNLLVVSVAHDMGLREFGMFDFALPAIIVGSAAIAYLWLIAPRLLPDREVLLSDTAPRLFDAILHISEDSLAVGRTLSDVLTVTDNRMKISRIGRGEGLSVTRLPSVVIREGDRLFVRDSRENLKEYERLLGATLHDVLSPSLPIGDDHPLSEGNQQLAEIVVTPGSILENWTLRKARFAERYQCVILAIHRARNPSQTIASDLKDVKLRAGDVLLVQGTRENVAELRRRGSMLVLDGTINLPRARKAPHAMIITFLVVLAAALGILPISVSALIGVAAMLLFRAMHWRDVGSALSYPVIMVIVVSLALGTALTVTGASQYVAELYVHVTLGLPPRYVLSGLILLMAIMTNIVSNNAAGVIGTPIAISIANQLGVHPEAFVLAVLFGANMSFATPIGYQTNLLLIGPGGYKFSDFLRVGVPLVLLMWIGFSIVLPILYPL